MLERLFLLRHGQTDWNRDRRWQGWTDVPLNETGRRQADLLAARLRDEPLRAIYASDLSRASETARRVAEGHGVEPILDRAWREIGLGELEGVPSAKARHKGDAIAATFREGALAPGAESFDELHGRLAAAYDRLVAAHPGESIAVVGHGGALRTLIAHVIGLPGGNVQHISLRGNASVSILDFRNGRPQLVLLNCVAHLREEAS